MVFNGIKFTFFGILANITRHAKNQENMTHSEQGNHSMKTDQE